MLRTLNAVVAGEAENGAAAVGLANGDEEYFSGLHCLEIELASDGFLPVLHDFGGVESTTEGLDRVTMRQRDLVNVRRFRPADLERSYPPVAASH